MTVEVGEEQEEERLYDVLYWNEDIEEYSYGNTYED